MLHLLAQLGNLVLDLIDIDLLLHGVDSCLDALADVLLADLHLADPFESSPCEALSLVEERLEGISGGIGG